MRRLVAPCGCVFHEHPNGEPNTRQLIDACPETAGDLAERHTPWSDVAMVIEPEVIALWDGAVVDDDETDR